MAKQRKLSVFTEPYIARAKLFSFLQSVRDFEYHGCVCLILVEHNNNMVTLMHGHNV